MQLREWELQFLVRPRLNAEGEQGNTCVETAPDSVAMASAAVSDLWGICQSGPAAGWGGAWQGRRVEILPVSGVSQGCRASTGEADSSVLARQQPPRRPCLESPFPLGWQHWTTSGPNHSDEQTAEVKHPVMWYCSVSSLGTQQPRPGASPCAALLDENRAVVASALRFCSACLMLGHSTRVL